MAAEQVEQDVAARTMTVPGVLAHGEPVTNLNDESPRFMLRYTVWDRTAEMKPLAPDRSSDRNDAC